MYTGAMKTASTKIWYLGIPLCHATPTDDHNTIGWHETRLAARKSTLARKQAELARLQAECAQSETEISHYQTQIVEAKRRGKASFDADRFLKKAKTVA